MKWNIFRGHVPAPVPDKELNLPPPGPSPAELRSAVALCHASALSKARELLAGDIGNQLRAQAAKGRSDWSFTPVNYGTTKEALATVLREAGFDVAVAYDSVNVSW